MDTLRWVLFGIGTLVILCLFGYYRWQEHRAERTRQRNNPPRAPRGSARDVSDALEDMDRFVVGDELDDLDNDALEPLRVDPDDRPDPRVARRAPESDGADEDADWTVGPVRVRSVGGSPGGPPEPDPAPEPAPEPARAGRGVETPPHRDDGWAGAPAEADDDDASPAMDPPMDPAPEVSTRDAAASSGPERAAAPAPEREAEEQIAAELGEKVIVLHVHAGEGMCFTAPAMREALERTGLRHGAHGIFHRHVNTADGPLPVFSVASMVKPGTLDPTDPSTLETPGLALFMQLPGPVDGPSGFEQMLETARRLADQLDGQLLDGSRCDLTNQAVEHIREELREYRRRAHLVVRKAQA